MKKSIHAWSRGVIAFCAATVVSSLFFAEANSSPRPIRGQPIQTRPPRGEPIQPIKPAQPAEPVQAQEAITEAPTVEVKPNEGSESASLERKGGRDYFSVGFDKLASFDYLVPEYTGVTPPPAPQTNQIPSNIQSFDGRRVALKGFMLPLKVEGGKVTELLLMRDQSMCCFGTVPKINEFVTVKMLGSGTRAVMDQAVTLYGTLKVGEFTENGYLLGIYQMDGELADGPGI
jgi:hypothetical protein